jgi:hypothetical protein
MPAKTTTIQPKTIVDVAIKAPPSIQMPRGVQQIAK